MRFLLSSTVGADALLEANGGATALATAEANGHEEAARLIRRHLRRHPRSATIDATRYFSSSSSSSNSSNSSSSSSSRGEREGRRVRLLIPWDHPGSPPSGDQDGQATGSSTTTTTTTTNKDYNNDSSRRGDGSGGAAAAVEAEEGKSDLSFPNRPPSAEQASSSVPHSPTSHRPPTAHRQRWFHAGAGAAMVDGAFSEAFLARLTALWRSLPTAPPEKAACSERAYFCDAEGWVSAAIAEALRGSATATATATGAGGTGAASSSELSNWNSVGGCSEAMPHMRFLHYAESGGFLAPHVDLSRNHPFPLPASHTHRRAKHAKDEGGWRSTHTFLLYLTDCAGGGETALLQKLPHPDDDSSSSSSNVLAAVAPRRGRLLVFPHNCPHEGRPVVDVPKVFLRGELL